MENFRAFFGWKSMKKSLLLQSLTIFESDSKTTKFNDYSLSNSNQTK